MNRPSRLPYLLCLAVGALVLTALGSQPGLRDFALIVGVAALLPLQVLRRLPLRLWLARFTAALGAWCLLWALPLLAQRPWVGALAPTARAAWRAALLELVPFFLVPVVLFAVIAALRAGPRGAAGSAGCRQSSPPPGSPRPAAG